MTEPQQVSVPLRLERNERLKVFAILSKHNDIPKELLHDKLFLSVVISYTPAEAVLGAMGGLERSGRKLDDYKTPYMLVGSELDVLVEPSAPSLDEILAAPRIQAEAEAEAGLEAKLISYVRLVFDKAGTLEEKKTAEAVIQKFNDYAQRIK